MSENKFNLGDQVDYHSVIGGPITSRGHKIVTLQAWSNGQMVAWITNKSGCVSCDALTLSRPKEE